MFNYQNLNDVEFEALCQDIMEKKLNTDLRIFAKGRDGGVDLTDSSVTHNIVIQVKHYINSKYSDLRSSLAKEIEKVNALKPRQYYICCSLALTDSNISEIYAMFSEHMDSDKNIVTLNEIDNFLEKPENADIVRKHYKLWLYSSNILSEIYNQDIFVDCEALLSSIEDECQYFVQTTSYEECLDCIKNSRIIMMVGAPGVGKTTTSKMLLLFLANQGYRVRYSTNGDISDIKRSLSGNHKEAVLLDDCLGQHYFSMKETQENELLSLIKYIKMSPNKVLILNSRITIFNEAKVRSEEFNLFLQDEKIKIHKIDMDHLTSIEKAKIFYNHLRFKGVPEDYYLSIKQDKRYFAIIKHPNYTPRIIEHITNHKLYITIPPDEYYEFVIDALSNPDGIWKNEFERRLKVVDRAFMNTLYSLTDTKIDFEVFRKCFNNRLKILAGIDTTIDNFEQTLMRLNGSLVVVFDNKGKKEIGVINPSVNDYLKSIFFCNTLELDEVRKAILYHEQLKRCHNENEYEEIIEKIMDDGSILNLLFFSNLAKDYFLISKLSDLKILNHKYDELIERYLINPDKQTYAINGRLSICDIVDSLLSEPLCSFYNIKEIVFNIDEINNILSNAEFEELVAIINMLFGFLVNNEAADKLIDEFITECSTKVIDETDQYLYSLDTRDYCDNIDIRELIDRNTKVYYNSHDDEYEADFDEDGAVEELEQLVEEDIAADLDRIVSSLPGGIREKIDLEKISIPLNYGTVEDVIKAYTDPNDGHRDSSYSHSRLSDSECLNAIEAIFNRDLN